ncbi:MAG TPA: SIMPL domain-containing protein [Candidatus Nanoarchaeia archaeon]|nr:SIMPL domain-containing protein [Candidatus Nanoarchaeia archaeon]
MDYKVGIGILLVAILVVGGYLWYDSTRAGMVVSVTGSASVEAIPDKAVVYFQVEGRDTQSAQDAKAKYDSIADDLVTDLIKQGIEKKDIIVPTVYVQPEYDWSSGSQKQKGFVASGQVEVRVTDFDDVAGIVDSGVDAGAFVQGINFELSEALQNKYKAETLEAAGQDAKVKAEALARGVDKKLGSLVSVESNDFGYQPWVYYARGGDMAVAESSALQKAVVDISPRPQEVRASITVKYKLR